MNARSLYGPLLIAFALCAIPMNTASAIEPETTGFIYAGKCSDAGQWTDAKLKNLPKCDETISAPIFATLERGMSLREAVDGRPLAGKVIGRLKFHQRVQIVELRKLSASPGDAHTMWIKVKIDSGQVLQGASAYNVERVDNLKPYEKREAGEHVDHPDLC